MSDWHEDVRKLGGERLINIIEEIREKHKELSAKFDKAFPASDYDGHCRYHELMIERISETKKLRQAIQEKTIAGLVWAFIVFVASMIYHGIFDKISIWR